MGRRVEASWLFSRRPEVILRRFSFSLEEVFDVFSMTGLDFSLKRFLTFSHAARGFQLEEAIGNFSRDARILLREGDF